LVIDDEPSIRASIRRSLRNKDYAVFEAADGYEGIKLARSELPDLILSDVMMSGMDGFRVLKELRSYPDTSIIPVILMTGVPEKANVRSSMEHGADDFLPKPFGPETLIAAIEARLERQRIMQIRAKQTELRLLELLSATADLIAIAEPSSGRLLYMNQAGKKLLAIKPAKFSELKLSELVIGSGLGEKIALAEKNGSWLGECILLAQDQRTIPASVQILQHRPPYDTPYLSFVARDVTERKRVEAELDELQQEFQRASRRAGMADVANSVLHNVGNVINSIGVASSGVARNLKQSKTLVLSKVINILRDHESDLGEFLSSDEKGKKIPGYLAQLSDYLQSENQNAISELDQLQEWIQHVKGIVHMQQSYAKLSGTVEITKVADVLEDVLRLTINGFTKSGIQINRDCDPDLTVMVERHKVVQILVNLVRNAKQACQVAESTEKQISIRVTADNDRLKVSVTDNGVGIASEDMGRIFAHGFTTKKDGHGFGLHSSKLAAREMNGLLMADSEGPGKGATFTLDLPLQLADKVQADGGSPGKGK
jgi:CheY-like chemotaxis protein